MPLTIRLLGPPEILVDGSPLKVDTRKAVALLAYLAASGTAQSRERLADLLWPDNDAERARATLRRTLSTLKSALGDRWLVIDRNRVALTPADIVFDIGRLSRLHELHDHPDGASCQACFETLQELGGMARGDFMQGFGLRDAPGFEDWMVAENERLRREVGALLDRLLNASVALGRDEVAFDVAEKRIAMDPLNEPAYRTLMRLHARKNDRGAVVATYRSLVATLDRELGVEPLEETTDLYRALSRGHTVEAAGPRPEVAATGFTELPFVGRALEWDRLVTAYQQTDRIIAVEGEPGIGKTRLVEEFVSHAEGLGARTVATRAHEGEANVAYGVLTEVLRGLITSRVLTRLSEPTIEELARLLPELEVQPAESPLASRFYEAVRSSFEEGSRGERSGVVVIDDAHWADEATLDVLAYLARRARETGICIVMTWRTGELSEDGILARLLRDVPSTRVSLSRFGSEEIARLITETRVAPDAPLEATVARLLHETEGVPYFVTEYVKALKSGAGWEVPATVRELLVKRLGNARGAAAQLLDAAAVFGRPIDLESASRVSGRTDLEAADALDDLAGAGLLRSMDGADRTLYEFSHDKLRAVAYEEMGPARRHVLHRRVAEAIFETATSVDRDGSIASVIARHFELGGVVDKAVRFHRKAGAWAQGVFAHTEALEHYRRVLALGDASAEVHEAIGDIHVVQGRYADAVASYETAAALTTEPGAIDRKLGALHLRRGDYDLAEAHLNDALARSTDAAATADILVDLSLSAKRRGSDDVALRHALEAVARASQIESPHVRARAENAAGMLASAGGDPDRARTHLQVALGIATRTDDLPAMTAALNNLALVEGRSGNAAAAIDLTRQALEACRKFGDRHREAALENNLADLYHALGDRDLAMEHLKRATSIFAEVGAEPEGPLPEVWKLVDW